MLFDVETNLDRKTSLKQFCYSKLWQGLCSLSFILISRNVLRCSDGNRVEFVVWVDDVRKAFQTRCCGTETFVMVILKTPCAIWSIIPIRWRWKIVCVARARIIDQIMLIGWWNRFKHLDQRRAWLNRQWSSCICWWCSSSSRGCSYRHRYLATWNRKVNDAVTIRVTSIQLVRILETIYTCLAIIAL